MKGLRKDKRPPPSYKEGELRDLSIKKMQDADFEPSDLTHLLHKAVKRAKGRIESAY